MKVVEDERIVTYHHFQGFKLVLEHGNFVISHEIFIWRYDDRTIFACLFILFLLRFPQKTEFTLILFITHILHTDVNSWFAVMSRTFSKNFFNRFSLVCFITLSLQNSDHVLLGSTSSLAFLAFFALLALFAFWSKTLVKSHGCELLTYLNILRALGSLLPLRA